LLARLPSSYAESVDLRERRFKNIEKMLQELKASGIGYPKVLLLRKKEIQGKCSQWNGVKEETGRESNKFRTIIARSVRGEASLSCPAAMARSV